MNILRMLMIAGGILTASVPLAQAAKEKSVPQAKLPYSSGVLDISDRQYYQKVRELISFARISVDVALEQASIRDVPNDPVKSIFEDLIQAAKRGVKVRIFLNTFAEDSLSDSLFLRDDELDHLQHNGVEIHFVNPKYKLSDRLLVVDREVVLDGGLAWTQQDLEQGYGSATLSYSAVLAQQKRTRMELLPLWDLSVEKDARQIGELAIPLFLLRDIRYFPNMVIYEDADAMKVFMGLLRLYYQTGKSVLTVQLDELENWIPSENTMDVAAIHFQIYKSLHRLEESYQLITIIEEQSESASIELRLPRDLEPVIRVPISFFDENYARSLSPQAIFSYLVLIYRQQASGQSPVWIGSERAVEQDFPVRKEHFRNGMEELRRANLVEIFSFPLRTGNGYDGPGELENRYLINEMPTMAERLGTWSRLRDQYGDRDFERARRLAELFGEPEDPKVVMAYLKMLNMYALSDVESLTQHLASLPAQSTLSSLHYLEQLLKNETQRTTGLGAA